MDFTCIFLDSYLPLPVFGLPLERATSIFPYGKICRKKRRISFELSLFAVISEESLL